MEPVDVLCCGLAALDLIQYVDAIPGPDQKVVPHDVVLDAGGPAANAARTAAALGSRTTLVTLLGTSGVADQVARQLTHDGVRLEDACPDDSDWQPPIAAVTVDREGRRTVVSATTLRAPAVPETPPLPTARTVLLDGHHLDLSLAVARSQHDAGATIVLDGGSWKAGLERLLPYVDVAVVSSAFSCPETHRRDMERIPFFAVTAGHRPISVPARLGSALRLISVPAVDAQDTLGAGDVLHGALCHELARQQDLDRQTFMAALTRAAEVASRSCTARGVLGWTRTG